MAVDHFCLKWNNFETSVLSAFDSLQTTEDLADVTLTCEGINIKAHKIILSAFSPYFRTVFKENPCSHPIVILKDVSHSDLLAVLNFMYRGEVLMVQDQVSSFLHTAEMLQVTGLAGSSSDVPYKVSNSILNLPKSKLNKSNTEPELQQRKKTKTVLKPKVPKENLEKEAIETVVVDNIKKEVDDSRMDHNYNESMASLPKSSILEAALEVKDTSASILERSLTSHSSVSPSPESPETADLEKQRSQKHRLSESSASSDLLQKYSKTIEEGLKGEGASLLGDVSVMNSRSCGEALPHHSSQCGQCPHCGKVYSNQSALKYHVRLVHSDLTNMYCCHLCPEAFDFREGYKKHMVDAHNVRN